MPLQLKATKRPLRKPRTRALRRRINLRLLPPKKKSSKYPRKRRRVRHLTITLVLKRRRKAKST